MATKSSRAIVVLEAQLTLNPRGRSVVNGTLVIDGEITTFKAELDARRKSQLESFVLDVASLSAGKL